MQNSKTQLEGRNSNKVVAENIIFHTNDRQKLSLLNSNIKTSYSKYVIDIFANFIGHILDIGIKEYNSIIGNSKTSKDISFALSLNDRKSFNKKISELPNLIAKKNKPGINQTKRFSPIPSNDFKGLQLSKREKNFKGRNHNQSLLQTSFNRSFKDTM